MNTTDKLAEALRLAREWFRHEEAGEGPQAYDVIKAADEAIAAYEAEQAAKAVPAGFKLVPVEPTLEMLTAAGREDDKAFIDGMPHGATAADTWAAMLAAAPTPPAPDCED